MAHHLNISPNCILHNLFAKRTRADAMGKDSEERYPAHSSLDIIDGKTIHKGNGWWRAVVFYEKGSEQDIALYWWHKNEDDSWKNIHKWKILDSDTWQKEK